MMGGRSVFGRIGLGLLACSAPAAAQTAPAPALARTPPATPVTAVDPARLAAARAVVQALVPPGTYRRLMTEQLPRMMESTMSQVAAMRPSQLGLPAKDGTDEPLGAAMAKQDPAYATKMADMIRAMGEEFGPLFDVLEPRMRAGLAQAFARRFTLAQLTDMAAFFATPSGAAFAGEYLLTFMDPEVSREMIAAMPDIMKAMPAILARLQARVPSPAEPPTRRTGTEH